MAIYLHPLFEAGQLFSACHLLNISLLLGNYTIKYEHDFLLLRLMWLYLCSQQIDVPWAFMFSTDWPPTWDFASTHARRDYRNHGYWQYAGHMKFIGDLSIDDIATMRNFNSRHITLTWYFAYTQTDVCLNAVTFEECTTKWNRMTHARGIKAN